MLYYCCVKGCKNNLCKKSNDANSFITFHSFPQNPNLKLKWLEAIRRPNWDVPSYALICSEHFDIKHIVYGFSGRVLKPNAVPVNKIPPVSKFNATDIEVCSMCLASDVKLYSCREGRLKIEFEQMMALSDKLDISGLPRFICYMCTVEVHKCCQFIDKCITAQATLLNVFGKHGKVTKKVLQNFCLSEPLSVFKQPDIEYTCDNDVNNVTILDSQLEVEDEYKEEFNEQQSDLKAESDEDLIVIVKGPINDDESDGEIYYRSDNDSVKSYSSDDKTLSIIKKAIAEINGHESTLKQIRPVQDKNYLTEKEKTVLEHFDIVRPSLQEQIDDWNSKNTNPPLMGEAVYHCETCRKQFMHLKTYIMHKRCHDKSRGKVVCPVCKVRYKTAAAADAHRRHSHNKKFHCKQCSNVFSNVDTAIKHHRYHKRLESQSGPRIRKVERSCIQCGITCSNIDELKSHTLNTHGQITKLKVDESHQCEKCDINFATEEALTVHLQSSSRHKVKSKRKGLDWDENRICYSCGKEFSTKSELTSHVKSEHKRKTYKPRMLSRINMHGNSRTENTYPTTCEHCNKTVGTRQEHWYHTLKEHRAHIDSYQRLITVMCETCGKGFQSRTSLRFHELRHAPPAVRCEECGRMFYDKYGLARHAHIHTGTRPYACAYCPLKFTQRPNFYRHAKVHSDVAAYECSMCGKKFKYKASRQLHIRTVHFKLPHPPRKKRTKTSGK